MIMIMMIIIIITMVTIIPIMMMRGKACPEAAGNDVWRLRDRTLNVGSMAGKGKELANMMARKKADMLYVQE